MDISLQRKLRKNIEDGTLRRIGGVSDIRLSACIIWSSTTDLSRAVKKKQFDSELYKRLKVLSMKIPPLREQKTFIPKLAKLLIHYSLEVQPDDQFLLATSPLAQELNLAVFEEAIKAGAHVMTLNQMPGANEIFFRNASDKQLEYISPIIRKIYEEFD